MKPYLRKRVIRKLVAALIDANLSCAELRQVSEAFLRDHSFQHDLAEVLNNLSMAMSPLDVQKPRPTLVELTDVQRSWTSHVYTIVKRRRMPKSAFAELVAAIRPQLAEQLDLDQTMSEMLATLAQRGTPEDYQAIALALERPLDDPYLKGIMRRSEGKPS